ncbi:GntR family transcriptional regulator [Streptomyces antimycoticus]|uniref:GntR family transcriptional regulator n=1 Tax=Streptomyces antimycoticus TaxID=68175 RepID=A0A499V2R9_9ACTN|nr:FadR/GntR family transcriptional regulator [Streptomyces antimycoticus]BBJ47120.1 GntR family transcriptional regulator [Streptomyces antimycoticus]
MSEEPYFRPVRPTRAYEAVVEQVEETLARGALRPGDRLPSERDLMSQFSVSRSTVREALRVLESAGLIRSRPGDPRGAEVLPYSTKNLRKPLERLAGRDGISLSELIQFRMILEGSANRLAARLRTDEQVAAIEAALERMREAIDEGYAAFSAADVTFHDVVARAGGNSLIQVCGEVVRGAVLALIEDKLQRAPDSVALMRQSVAHHAEVFEAVRHADLIRADRLARCNLYEYYASYVTEESKPMLRALLEE